MFSPKHKTFLKKQWRFKRKSFLWFCVFIFGIFGSGALVHFSQAAAGINKQISFQGKVVNTNGTNVANGNYDFVFKLYSVDTGGSPIWTESRTGGNQVTVTDGIFQVNLGSVTALPGSVDFNTDTIYLGIEFSGDGEMSPRVRFTAAPYAFNADKIHGLTVTDTTGTLTIPNGKTIQFADAFTTSGAFPLTLTSTATTNATIPSGTVTLVDLATAQSLTNKTIGSTGLTFSGASTDITTATNEDFTLVANGAGIINLNDSVTTGALTISGAATDITTGTNESLVIVANGAGTVDIQDATTVDSLTADTGGVSIAAGQSYTGAGAVTLSSTTNGLTLDSGNNTLTVAASDTALTASGVATLTLAANASITNASGNLILQPAGAGTIANVQIGAGGAGSTTPDFFGLDVKSDTGDPAGGFEGAMYYNTLDNKFRCYQGAGWTDCIGGGSSYSAGSGLTLATTTFKLGGALTEDANFTSTGGPFNLTINDSGTGLRMLENGSTPTYYGIFDVADLSASNKTYTFPDVSGTVVTTGDTGSVTGTMILNDTVALTTDTSGNYVQRVQTNVLTGLTGGSAGSEGADLSLALDYSATLAADPALAANGTVFAATGLLFEGSGADANEGLLTPTNPTADRTWTLQDSSGVIPLGTAGNTLFFTTSGSTSVTLPTSGTLLTQAYATVQEEGTPLTQRSTLNFIGSAITCVDNAGNTRTDCTVTGGTTDLQTAYNNDADGGNATISLLAADDGLIITNPASGGNDLSAFTLQVSQLNTTAAITTLDLVQASNNANGVDITANSIDTEYALTVTANALTTGRGLSIASSSNSFTTNGALAYLAYTGSSSTGAILRVDDAAGDTSPFVIDPSGNVGIGVVTPASLFEMYGSAASDVVATLTSATTTNDPLVKLRTGSSPAIQFTLGVDNDDSDKFKIYSGDGLSGGDEFVIDSTGVTTIANLNLGATSFDTNAGAIAWVDMPVTSTAADNTVESYTAQLDGNTMLTVYALSDGAGAVDTKRVQLGDGGAGVAQPVLFGLDVRTGTGDPTDGFEGAMYYNTTDNKFRCYQGAAWTDCIGSGGTTDLQTAYNNDADGSNTTISLTAADDGLIITNPSSAGNNLSAFTLQVSQLNTTATITTLDLVQGSNAANAVDITANSIDTESALTVTANALTTGKGISVTHGTTVIASGGSLLNLSSTSADTATTSGTLLNLSSTNSTAGTLALITNNTASFTGITESISMTGATTGTGLKIGMGSTLTTGKALDITGASYVHGAETGSLVSLGLTDATTAAVTSTTNGLLVSPIINAPSGAATRTINGVAVSPTTTACAAGTCAVSGLNIGGISEGADAARFASTAITVGTGWDTILGGSTAGTNLIGFSNFTVTSAGAVTAAAAIAANGGITFDQTTDTVGSFTSAGTILMNSNILQDIGNTGTDFIASTGALTLAGVLTANGGVSLAGSQSFTASALAYVDLGSITQSTTANQGLRLPQAASATPSNPTSGEGYLAWDAAGNQLITYNGSAWTTISGGSGYSTIKDETTGLTQRTTLAFLGAGVTCSDSGSQTECTIAGGGGGEDLQTTYATDVDGGNVTISLTTGDDSLVFTNPTSNGTDSAFLLSLTQQNTTAAVTVLDMTQSSNNANGVNLTANSIDGETGLAITTNGLTSGKGISVTSSAAASFTGSLVDVNLSAGTGASSNTGSLLTLTNSGTANANTSLVIQHNATGTGNLAMRVNDVANDTTPFVIDGNGSVGIGTSAPSGLLQVGGPTLRGDVNVYGNVNKKSLAITRSITGTIADVFVYDTTRDADNGRWRIAPATRALSWYTETLDNTGPACNFTSNDRCGGAPFPEKAIIVATSDAVYIFDADDNTMWMKFDQNTSNSCVTGPCTLGANASNDPSSVFALNGVLYVGTNGASATGLYAIDFINDRLYRYNATDRTLGDKNIANRNTVLTYGSGNTKFALNNATVNDVHGAVISGSTSILTNSGPLQGGTFICAATGNKISVINLSSGVTLDYGAASKAYTACFVTRRARLYGINSTDAQVERYGAGGNSSSNVAIDMAVADQTTATDIWDETSANTPNLAKTTPTIISSPDTLEVVERGSLAQDPQLFSSAGANAALQPADLIYVGTGSGLTEIRDVDSASGTVIGWSKYYTKDFETPYMSGTPRLALPLNETSGTTVADASLRNNTIQVKGSATLGVDGVHGTGIRLDGSSAYLCTDTNSDGTCDQDTDFDPGTISWFTEMWFRHDPTIAATQFLLDRSGNSTVAGINISMTNTGTVTANMRDGTNTDTATSTQSFNDGLWHHLVVERVSTALTNPALAVGLYMFIDGRLVGSDTSIAASLTLNGASAMTIGAACTGTVTTCTTQANYWNGDIDDVYISMNGATSSESINQFMIRKRYLEGRAALQRKTLTALTADINSTSTIGKTGQTWVFNDYAGQIVEITSGTGAGQTRRIVGNSATTLTVSPNWTTPPDGTSVFTIQPERLYGASNNVNAIGLIDNKALGEGTKLYVGTNSTTDTGGVSVFEGYGTPSISNVYHSATGVSDDNGTAWSGTGADDMKAIGSNGTSVSFGSSAAIWSEEDELSLQGVTDRVTNELFAIRGDIISKGLLGISSEAGQIGGADLAENYYSDTPLPAGSVVSLDPKRSAYVRATSGRSARDMLGVVATSPGIVLGDPATNGYPIALVGRVPVLVTNENGPIYAGDRITSASRSGFAMRATQAGRVLGQALSDAGDWTVCDGEDPNDMHAPLCTTVMVFVNLTDYSGQPVDLAMAERDAAAQALAPVAGESEAGLAGDGVAVRLATAQPTREEKIMSFLKTVRDERTKSQAAPSEVFTDRVAASTEIVTPKLIVDEIFAKSIKADSIEGLEVFTDSLKSLQAKYAGLEAANTSPSAAAPTPTTVAAAAQALRALSADTLTVQLDGSILGKLSVAGALTIGGPAEFQGDTLFGKLATFLGETVFQGRVDFASAPTFSSDTAGFAMIEKGAKQVRVTFETPYERQPIVAVTLTNDTSPLLDDKADDTLKADVAAVEKDYLETVFASDVRYIVTEKDQTGFTIVLSEKAPQDLQFSWVAIAVKKVKSFTSEKAEEPKADSAVQGLGVVPNPSPQPAAPQSVTPIAPLPPAQSEVTPPKPQPAITETAPAVSAAPAVTTLPTTTAAGSVAPGTL